MSDAGQRHREREAARSRANSRSVRDIAPLPPIKNPKRRAEAAKSLKTFLETYLKQKFSKPWSKAQLKVIDRLETIIKDGGKMVLSMPRGEGKTTITVGGVQWAIYNGYRKFIMIVGVTDAAAGQLLDSIKKSLQKNKMLLDDYPEIVYPFRRLNGSALLARGQLFNGELTNIEWKGDKLTFPSIPGSTAGGSQIRTVGIFGKIRGKQTDTDEGFTIRPDLVVIDDPQDENIARSPKQIDKAEKVIEKAICGLAGPGVELTVAMLVTVIQENDLADRYLNPNIYPQWKGMRFKAVEQMPERMDLWKQYSELRKQGNGEENAFYNENWNEMHKGAVVSWEANFTPQERDALQHEMNKWSDNLASFMAERQNEPLSADVNATVVPAKEIRKKLNGLQRCMVPSDTYKTVAFIDVHKNLLYYTVCGFADDFTGYVIDYGTFPEQKFKNFQKNDAGLETMKDRFGGRSKETYIAAGLEWLIGDLLAESYAIENGTDTDIVKIDRLLIDCGYASNVIETVLRKFNQKAVIRPSFGRGIGAKNAPMSEWKPKEKFSQLHIGHHWCEDRAEGKSYRVVKIDTNYWKTYIHEAFELDPSERGSLSLWGSNPRTHQMFSDHLVAESVQFVEVGSRKVNEWSNPFDKDNHFFDCLVGCCAAASTVGVQTVTEREKPKPLRIRTTM